MKKTLFATCLCILQLFLATSCSENTDDPEYRSQPPIFSGMQISALGEAPGNVFSTGTTLVATATQSRKGRLLYRAEYNWTCELVDVEHKNTAQVVYDKDSSDPTDTLTISDPGTYKLTFSGRFHMSGSNYETLNGVTNTDNGTVTYSTPSFMYYDITVERTFRVN